MPRGEKSAYTDKQKRKAEHIEEGYKERGVKPKEAKSRAWATVNKQDVIDKIYSGIVSASEAMHRLLSYFQNGILRWYIMGIVAGAILILTYRLLV